MNDRLRDIDDGGPTKEDQAERRQLGREGVVALLAHLSRVAASQQLRQQAMGRAARNLEFRSYGGERHALWLAGERLENSQRPVDGTDGRRPSIRHLRTWDSNLECCSTSLPMMP